MVLARAPQPGSRTFLDPAWVRRQAARHGLEWANATALERVAVERASQSLGASDIADLIAARMYRETGRSHEVTLSNRMLTLHAPSAPLADRKLSGWTSTAGPGRFVPKSAPMTAPTAR